LASPAVAQVLTPFDPLADAREFEPAHVGYLARDWSTGAYAILDLLELRAQEGNNLWHSELFEGESLGFFLAAGKAGYTFNSLLSFEDEVESLGLGLPAFGVGGTRPESR
jgi:hypothetical protein